MRYSMWSRRVAVMLLASGTALSAQAADGRFALQTVARFGTSPEREAQDTFPFGGGSLSQVAAIRPLSGGRVAVLDAGFKKVVIFDRTGRIERVLGRGQGRGPGEFLFPTGLAVTGDTIAVFDYSQNRITSFSTSGQLLFATTSPRAKDIAIVGREFWGAAMPGVGHMLWRTSFSGGIESAQDALPVDREHAAFEPRGVYARLGVDVDGSTLIAHQRPGLWFELGSDATISTRRGTDMLAGGRFFAPEGIPVAPGQTDGIAGLSPARIAIMYTRFSNQGNGRPPRMEPRRIVVLDRASGRVLGHADFVGLQTPVTAIAPGPNASQLYYVAYEPYPHIVLANVVGPQTSR
jgi:hypothetical protein